jgi:hypothetical protein
MQVEDFSILFGYVTGFMALGLAYRLAADLCLDCEALAPLCHVFSALFERIRQVGPWNTVPFESDARIHILQKLTLCGGTG